MIDSHDLDEQLLQRLPLPLAQLCRRGQNAKTPLERHLTAYYLWESALKLLAATAVVEYAELKQHEPELTEMLKNLARPSVGQWWEFVRRLVPVLADKGDEGFVTVRELVLGRARDDLPRAAGLYAALTEALEGKGGARATVRLTELFDRMVTYRNREIGHGAAGQRPDDFYQRMARSLFLGLAQVLGRLDVFASRRLVYVSDVARLASGGWLIERYILVGEAARRIDPLQLPETEGDRLPRPECLYLEGKGDPKAVVPLPVLHSLYPLFHYEPESGKFYFLNARRGKKQIEYLCYTTGEVFRHESVRSEECEWLARILGRPVDAGSVKDWATRSLAEEPAVSPVLVQPGERTIGEFELLSRLGQGGMGVVYRAWQPSLGRQVALKCMLRSGDPKAEARFAREIRALGRVEHPNVVKVFTSGAEGDQWFYAMELVEGAELSAVCDQLTGSSAVAINASRWRQALSTAYEKTRSQETVLSQAHSESSKAKQAKSPSDHPVGAASTTSSRIPVAVQERSYIQQVVEIIRQTAAATHALHEANVVHRDIKPSNIMLTADGTHAVLLDLGLAQLADETEKRLTRTRQFVGTLRYASPEQILAAGRVDRRTDIYSLGATLWELLTLLPIYGADDEMPIPDLMLKIQTTDPDSPRRYNRYVTRDLEAIVLKCLNKDPGNRYATAKELAKDLSRWQAGGDVLAERFGLWYKLRKRAKQHRRSIIWVVAMIVAVSVGIAIYSNGKRENTDSPKEDPLVELRRAEVRREVDSLRRRPPTIISTRSAAFEEVEKLPSFDYSAFEILSDDRVVDLREWKRIPAERSTELVCASSMIRNIRLRKVQAADEIHFESRTTGAEAFMHCLSHPDSYRVVAQKSPGFVGANRTRIRQMVVDVRKISLQTEFTIQIVITYWNSMQGEDDLWFGAIGYESSFKVSLLIVYPPDKPFKNYELKVAPTTEQKPFAYQDRKILIVPESRDWVYWEIPKPKAGHVYLLYWTW